MKTPYVSPEMNASGYNCPHCGAYAQQTWATPYVVSDGPITNLRYGYCSHCLNYTLWHYKKMIYPNSGTAPMPIPDMPNDIRLDYEEARSIVSQSPRGAAALLRLCIQKLCKELGEGGKDINSDIKNLVAKGLPPTIQQSLDIVRVIGNEAVHPGQIDLTDDVETAVSLFGLLNYIVEDRITRPKEVATLYAMLPSNKIKGIEDRDNPPK